jgi:hypothetical protein
LERENLEYGLYAVLTERRLSFELMVNVLKNGKDQTEIWMQIAESKLDLCPYKLTSSSKM